MRQRLDSVIIFRQFLNLIQQSHSQIWALQNYHDKHIMFQIDWVDKLNSFCQATKSIKLTYNLSLMHILKRISLDFESEVARIYSSSSSGKYRYNKILIENLNYAIFKLLSHDEKYKIQISVQKTPPHAINSVSTMTKSWQSFLFYWSIKREKFFCIIPVY